MTSTRPTAAQRGWAEDWESLVPELRDAAVFTDECFEDCLRWNASPEDLLVSSGADTLQTLCAGPSPPASLSAYREVVEAREGRPSIRLVFLVSGFLPACEAEVLWTLREVTTWRAEVAECLVYCGVSSDAHSRWCPGSLQMLFAPFRGAYAYYQDVFRRAAPSVGVVAVLHFPALYASVLAAGPELVMLPLGREELPWTATQDETQGGAARREDHTSAYALLAERVTGLFGQCAVWAVGVGARKVGTKLAAMMMSSSPSHQTDAGSGSGSTTALVLIDRSLNLGPCMTHGEPLLDRVFSSTNVSVLGCCDVRVVSAETEGALFHTLSHCTPSQTELLGSALTLPPKKFSGLLRKKLRELLSVAQEPSSSDDAMDLEALLSKSKELVLRSVDLYDWSSITLSCFWRRDQEMAAYDQVVAIEKSLAMLGASGAASGEDFAQLLEGAINGLSFEFFVELMGYAFATQGDLEELRELASQRLVRDYHCSEDAVTTVLGMFSSLCPKGLTSTGGVTPSPVSLGDTLRRVFSPGNRDSTVPLFMVGGDGPEEAAAASVLKRGLFSSLKLLSRQPSSSVVPAQGAVLAPGTRSVILFFLSGISLPEIREVREFCASHPDASGRKVLVCSTKLLTPRHLSSSASSIVFC